MPPPTVLFVCTGNLCRSPLMERLLRAAWDAQGMDGALEVRSAGTHAYDGDAMHPHSAAVLAARGLDGSDFTTTYLTEAVLEGVDLLVAATRAHRAAAVTLRPGLVNRAFTLAELSRICAGLDPEVRAAVAGEPWPVRLTALVGAAAARRTATLPEDPRDDDLDDPLGGPVEDFAACAGRIEALLGPVLVALGGAG